MDGLTPRVAWRTSSYSGSSGDNCVEVGAAARAVAVRDSTDPDGPALAFSQRDWRTFTRDLKARTADR